MEPDKRKDKPEKIQPDEQRPGNVPPRQPGNLPPEEPSRTEEEHFVREGE